MYKKYKIKSTKIVSQIKGKKIWQANVYTKEN